jgi:hypothetical protein
VLRLTGRDRLAYARRYTGLSWWLGRLNKDPFVTQCGHLRMSVVQRVGAGRLSWHAGGAREELADGHLQVRPEAQ